MSKVFDEAKALAWLGELDILQKGKPLEAPYIYKGPIRLRLRRKCSNVNTKEDIKSCDKSEK